MKKSDAYFVGKIVKPYGTKGEVLVKLDTDEPEIYEDLESVFLEIKGELVPFFIDNAQLHKSHLLRLRFEDIDHIDKTANLIGRKLYLPLDSLPELTGNKFYYHEIQGFDVEDKKLGPIGIIEGVNDMAPQPYFIIKHPSGKEILVPVKDIFIEKVDRDQKKIILDTPDGLVNLYLDESDE